MRVLKTCFAAAVAVGATELEVLQSKLQSLNQSSERTFKDGIFQMMMFYGVTDMQELDQFMDYGCWCQIGETITPGKGQPLDEFDSLCKAWQQCQTCVSQDNNCDTATTVYEVGFDPETLRIDCQFNGPCAMNKCQCDELLSFEIQNLLKEQELNPNHMGSVLDRESQCKAAPVDPNGSGPDPTGGSGPGSGNGSGNEIEFSCCGSYPDRFLFNSGGDRQCCGSKTFNSKTKECCADLTIKGLGNC